MFAKNRYGAAGLVIDGEECCRHGVSLDVECRRCVQVMEINAVKYRHNPERPHLVGAGPVVPFEGDIR